MHIEDIFEDLEAQFDAVQEKDHQNFGYLAAKITEVKTQSFSAKLIAPIIGVDFIAGLDLEKPTWHIFSSRFISEVSFLPAQDQTLPRVRQLEESLVAFLQHLPLPGLIRWRTMDNPDFINLGALRGITHGLLMANPAGATKQIFVPILSLAQLSIDSIES
jgi:hypothetical protein